jgi:LCP family protein required for cell wall assembly
MEYSSPLYRSTEPWSATQPVKYHERGQIGDYPTTPNWMKPRKKRWPCCLFTISVLLLFIPLLIYFLLPVRTNILLLGIDYTKPGSYVGRSDTIILTTIVPLKPYVGMLSIPRDLWVNMPGIGENRINTAHFFAEANQAGTGGQAAVEAVKANFGINIHYYLRIRFEGLKDVVDAMGGVDVNLPEPMAGYSEGLHHLSGNKALAFARNRASSDDFFRMQHGQLLIKSMIKQLIMPNSWEKLPQVLIAGFQSLDTNIPWWQWPRLSVAFLRAGPEGIDNQIISREMATPFTTDQGANILIPNWPLINPLLMQMFGQ